MPPAQAPAAINQTDLLKTVVLRSSLAVLGGVGAVVYATMKNHKGRFWWFLGGSLAGGAIGTMVGILMAKQDTAAAPAVTSSASNFVNDYVPRSSFGDSRGRGEAGGMGHTSRA